MAKVLHQMGTLLMGGSGKSSSGKCSTIWQVGPGRSAISAIGYSESSDWKVGTVASVSPSLGLRALWSRRHWLSVTQLLSR